MALVIGTGITIETGITVSSEFTGPESGTLVPYTSGTYFDSWTSQSGVTTSDFPTANTAGASSSYNTNNLSWQLLYAWQAITIPLQSPQYGVATTVAGSNSATLRYSLSSADYTIGGFGADTQIGTNISGSYTAGGFFTGQATSTRSIPANRYFLLGITGGPFYRSFKILSANRTATIGGSPVFTVINKFWWPGWPTGPTSGIPTQLGGATAGYTEQTGYVPVTSFIFTVP
jgi:hypothetical protein